MEWLNNIIKTFFNALITQSLKSDANNTTSMLFYQPKVPAELKKFSKIEKE